MTDKPSGTCDFSEDEISFTIRVVDYCFYLEKHTLIRRFLKSSVIGYGFGEGSYSCNIRIYLNPGSIFNFQHEFGSDSGHGSFNSFAETKPAQKMLKQLLQCLNTVLSPKRDVSVAPRNLLDM
jgi:hypothetical protein